MAAASAVPQSLETKLGRALIVDDDVALCNAMSRYLTQLGYEVVTAFTGSDGLLCMQSGDFDVGIFDLHLPDTSGRNLLIAFKEKSPQSDAIMLTGSGSLEVAMEAIRSGAFDFITKPFVLEQLERSLSR
ncbi:MAG TPA: response regulator, partial [Polyangiaceae bacterium]|nr:response regulator [Polyangiaceae bacterium]